MKIETLKIEKVDSVTNIEINGKHLEHVLDYKFSSSAERTELELLIDISDAFMRFETSANQTKQTSLE